jgi:hypothetical protein
MPPKTRGQNGEPIPNVVSVENSDVPFNIVERDDGKWAWGWHDGAPGPFDSRADAARVASGYRPAPVRKFGRIRSCGRCCRERTS